MLCGLRVDEHDRSTTQVIDKILHKFEETGSIIDVGRSRHHRFVRSSSNIATVLYCRDEVGHIAWRILD